MKLLLLFALLLTFGYLHAQDGVTYQAENMYPYNGHYINLENVEKIIPKANLSTTFKTARKYSSRFAQPFWFETEISKVSYQDKYFELDEDQVKITDFSGKLIKKLPNKEKGQDLDNTTRSHLLLSTSHGIIHIKRLDSKYIIYKYNEAGEELFKTTFNHTEIKVNDNTRHYSSYLHYFKHTNNHAVFTAYDNSYKTTTVLDLKTGKTVEYNFIADGIIRSEDEQSIIGLIEIDGNIKAHFKAHKWKAEGKNNHDDAAETLIHGNTLVVAHYMNIATGSGLQAFDVKTGKQLWKADVRQLIVEHSKYYNGVRLSLHENKLIMEGKEAYGSYLQIFDIKTGKKLFDADE